MPPTSPLGVDRVEDVTSEHLDGASEYELAAFQTAVMEFVLDAEVPVWVAITIIWDAGNWREVVAERCELQWTIAQRLTEEERHRGTR